jgi:hypothetical protein
MQEKKEKRIATFSTTYADDPSFAHLLPCGLRQVGVESSATGHSDSTSEYEEGWE